MCSIIRFTWIGLLTVFVLGIYSELAPAQKKLWATPAGHLHGKYTCDNGLVGARFDLNLVGADKVDGSFSFFPLDPKTEPAAQPNFTGSSYRVSGTYDPKTGEISLSPGAWIGPQNAIPIGFKGIYVAAAGALSVEPVRNGRPFTRCSTVVAGHKGALGQNQPRAAKQVVDPNSIACNEFVDWASEVGRQYPDMNIPQTETSVVVDRSLPLFYDATFPSMFGRPFDALSVEQRKAIGNRILACQREVDPHGPLLAVAVRTNPFFDKWRRGAGPRYEAIIATNRILQVWQTQMLSTIKEAPNTRQGIAEVRTILAAVPNVLGREWPSTRAAFDNTGRDHLAAIANITITAEIAAFKSAKPSYEQAIRLQGSITGNEVLGAALTPSGAFDTEQATRNRQQVGEQRFTKKRGEALGPGLITLLTEKEREAHVANGKVILDKMLAKLAKDEIKALGKVEPGLAGLEKVRGWWYTVSPRYSRFVPSAAYDQLSEHAETLRHKRFPKAKAALLKQIKNAQTEKELGAISVRTFMFPEEAETKLAEELKDAIHARQIELDREAYLAHFSARERSMMNKRDRIVPPNTYSAPNGEEVRLALVREIAGLWGERRGPNKVRAGSGNLGKIASFDITTQDATDVRCRKDGGAFECIYKIRLQVRLVGELANLGGGNDPRALFLQFLAEQFGRSNSKLVDRFELTGTGWRSPTIRKRYAIGILNGIQATMEGMAVSAARGSQYIIIPE